MLRKLCHRSVQEAGHPFDRYWQCRHLSESFGAEAVVDAVLAASEGREEEADSIVAEFPKSRQPLKHVTAALIGQTLLKLQVAETFSLVKRQLLFIPSCVVIAVILHRFRRLEDNESARGRFLG